ncbi:SRP40 C-terminal domain-containing protein [Elsinoe australis]|uniref:SRP40 C-terminal domain-containing protein n=1 Tax=Elsinoe australis TaxID=40998 RepID=A0A4U7ARL3_9PEZI|nr:SRP40 C-terminal domain-containing protein [Elsinoe australis]
MASETPLVSLLHLTSVFLSGNGFSKTAAQLQKEAQKRGLSLNDPKPETTLPTLDSVFTYWQSQHPTNEDEGSESDDESSSASSSSESDSDSDSDSESEDVKMEDVKPTKAELVTKAPKASVKTDEPVKAKGIKRKRDDSSSSDSSSSESSSDSSSESDGDSGSDSDSSAAKPKKTVSVKKAAAVPLPESGSDSDSSSSESESAASISSKSESSSSESEEEETSSDSDSDSEPEIIEVKTSTKKIPQEASSTSSATLEGSPVHVKKEESDSPVPIIKQEEPDDGDIHPSRKRQLDSFNDNAAKRLKKTNEPFSRIPKDQYVDPKLASNKYVAYDYANRAHEKLIVTKGKGFTKEKNKGKRGSYRGGKIDFASKGIKFDD